MTHKTNRYGLYKTDYTKFGGIIYPYDYNTELGGKLNTKGSPIASRIMSDSKIDKQCQRNLELRKGKNKNE